MIGTAMCALAIFMVQNKNKTRDILLCCYLCRYIMLLCLPIYKMIFSGQIFFFYCNLSLSLIRCIYVFQPSRYDQHLFYHNLINIPIKPMGLSRHSYQT